MDDIAYRRAQARVEARLAFYRHATVYVLVNLFLIILNLLRSPDELWFYWPLLGWGIGLLSHAFNVYSYRWEGPRKDRMIQRELERETRLRGTPPT